MTQPTKATTTETGAPVAAPLPSSTELARRLEQDRLPRDWGRLLSSVVTGLFSLCTGVLAIGASFRAGDPIVVAVILGVFGGMSVGTGWITWRWARSLPPVRFLATPRERDELDT